MHFRNNPGCPGAALSSVELHPNTGRDIALSPCRSVRSGCCSCSRLSGEERALPVSLAQLAQQVDIMLNDPDVERRKSGHAETSADPKSWWSHRTLQVTSGISQRDRVAADICV